MKISTCGEVSVEQSRVYPAVYPPPPPHLAPPCVQMLNTHVVGYSTNYSDTSQKGVCAAPACSLGGGGGGCIAEQTYSES